MKLLTKKVNYEKTIKLAKELKITNEQKNSIEPVIFHCYWYGTLSEKHFRSIFSCYHFHHEKHKIILWLENNTENEYNNKISKIAEIKNFCYENEIEDEDTKQLFGEQKYFSNNLSYYSDFVRYVLLYKYGGIWFDLDIFFLRSFDPIFYNYSKKICVYQWEYNNYPNNAIYISLKPKSKKLRNVIQYIKLNKVSWGFQNCYMIYKEPIKLFVLPCSWFNASWIKNPLNITCFDFFKYTNKKYDFENFFPGSFCFHWHNQWDNTIEEHSIMDQLWTNISCTSQL